VRCSEEGQCFAGVVRDGDDAACIAESLGEGSLVHDVVFDDQDVLGGSRGRDVCLAGIILG
jgi:hypothetical protein